MVESGSLNKEGSEAKFKESIPQSLPRDASVLHSTVRPYSLGDLKMRLSLVGRPPGILSDSEAVNGCLNDSV